MSEAVYGDPEIDKDIRKFLTGIEGYANNSDFMERRNCSLDIHRRGYLVGKRIMQKHQQFLAEKAMQSEDIRNQISIHGTIKFRQMRPDGSDIIDALEKYPNNAYLKAKGSL